jgi:putative Mn2+ efflux pump MntP
MCCVLLGFAVSIDGFIASISYGLENINFSRIRPYKIIVITYSLLKIIPFFVKNDLNLER